MDHEAGLLGMLEDGGQGKLDIDTTNGIRSVQKTIHQTLTISRDENTVLVGVVKRIRDIAGGRHGCSEKVGL